jgi:dimeric dUTPase (all-alpha-NTP-PPase superfamily)
MYMDMYMLAKNMEVYAPHSLTMGLEYLARVQRVVSAPVEGCVVENGQIPTKDQLRTYTLAMMVELTEWLQTLDWKPWKEKAIDGERVLDEFADILAFQGILIHYLNCLGFSAAQIAEAYNRKSIVNMGRFMGNHGEEYKQKSLFKE